METTQRILVVDDHTLMRNGLRSLLAQDPSLEVVGEADNGRDAILAAGRLAPHLVLMDLSMPGMNGIEAIAQIKQRYPDVRVLAMTMHGAEEYFRAALKAGANGYILKEATSEEFRVAIRSVLQGKTYLSKDVSGKVVRRYLGEGKSSGAGSVYNSLTNREREVLKLVAEGRSNKYIAGFLGLSVKTVGNHRASLMMKLDLHNASDLTAYAIQKGLTVRSSGMS